jgi:hypothetical protein
MAIATCDSDREDESVRVVALIYQVEKLDALKKEARSERVLNFNMVLDIVPIYNIGWGLSIYFWWFRVNRPKSSTLPYKHSLVAPPSL